MLLIIPHPTLIARKYPAPNRGTSYEVLSLLLRTCDGRERRGKTERRSRRRRPRSRGASPNRRTFIQNRETQVRPALPGGAVSVSEPINFRGSQKMPTPGEPGERHRGAPCLYSSSVNLNYFKIKSGVLFKWEIISCPSGPSQAPSCRKLSLISPVHWVCSSSGAPKPDPVCRPLGPEHVTLERRGRLLWAQRSLPEYTASFPTAGPGSCISEVITAQAFNGRVPWSLRPPVTRPELARQVRAQLGAMGGIRGEHRVETLVHRACLLHRYIQGLVSSGRKGLGIWSP